MSKFCSNCGSPHAQGASFCAECGSALEPSTLPTRQPESAQRPELSIVQNGTAGKPASNGSGGGGTREELKSVWAQAAGDTDCPGCRKTSGPPGAICPACGSRYPSPRAALVGICVAAVGALLLLIAWIAQGELGGSGSSGQMSGLEVFGWLGLFGGLGGVVYSFGRSGPKGQTSCCGCSCLVLVLVVPAGAMLLWQSGGPLLAAAALPLAIPLTWCLDASASLGWAMRESVRLLSGERHPAA